MITTFTSTSRVNSLHQQPELPEFELTEEATSSFYDSIKPELNKLIKDPTAETIKKILAYSANK
jgi:hypothetical protein